jgi:hypothetical protein
MFIVLYSSDTLSGIANHVVTFSTNSKIGNYSDKIVFVAHGLQIVIPFLAFTIMKGGVGGFIHLAGVLSGASQSAAAQAANESVTGNKSFDNYSVGNKQLYNESGFKTDYNRSYAAGAATYQHSDGSMEKVTAGGNTLMQSGAGFTDSMGASNYKQEQSRHGQVNEGSQNSEALQAHDSRSLSSAKSKTFSNASDYVSQIAQREHSGKSVNYEEMGDHGEAVNDTVRTARELHDKKGYDWEKSSTLALNASAGTKILGTGVTLEGRVAGTDRSNTSSGESSNTSTDKGSTENYNNVVKALSNNSWAKDNNFDSSYSDSVRESNEEVQRAEQQLSVSTQQVEDWHKARSIMESEGSSASTEKYQEVLDGIKQEYGVDTQTAQVMASRRTPEAQAVWSKMQKEDHYVDNLMQRIAKDRESVSGDQATNKLDKFSKNAEGSVSSDMSGMVKQNAAKNGLNVDNVKKEIQSSKTNIEGKFTEIRDKNSNKYEGVKKQSEIDLLNRESELIKSKSNLDKVLDQNKTSSKIVDKDFYKNMEQASKRKND